MDEVSNSDGPSGQPAEAVSPVPPTPAKKRGRPTNAELAERRKQEIELEKQFPERALKRLQKLFDQVMDTAEAKIDRIAPGQIPMAIGILWDKIQSQQRPTVTNQTNIQINGLNREEALALLTGKSAAKELSVAPLRANTAGSALSLASSIGSESGDIKSPASIGIDT